ncbi:MAG: hypothetical protein HOV66_25690 [Streptomycetaceae bacterium]|nr:hypothetical protein [Streptomycetaceae bacterium]
MVTFDELKNAKFDGIRAHADACTRTMNQLDEIVRDFELGVCGATEQAGWRGHTAGTANLELEETLRRIRVASLEVRSIAAELDFAADELTSCQAKLFTEMYAALSDGLTVAAGNGQFFVTEAAPPTTPRDAQQQAAAQTKVDACAQRLQQVLDAASAADARHAEALARLNPDEVAAGDDAALKNAMADLDRTFTGMVDVAERGGTADVSHELPAAARPHGRAARDRPRPGQPARAEFPARRTRPAGDGRHRHVPREARVREPRADQGRHGHQPRPAGRSPAHAAGVR